MMHWLWMIFALLLGLGLSGIYFGGLWGTVRRLQGASRPKLLLLGSFLVRTALVLAGFYLLLRGLDAQWEALGLALLGFLVGRWLLIRRWKPQPTPSPRSS